MLSALKTLSVGTPIRKVYRSCKEPVGRRIFCTKKRPPLVRAVGGQKTK